MSIESKDKDRLEEFVESPKKFKKFLVLSTNNFGEILK